MVDSKENYKFDLEVKGLIYFFLSQNRRIKTLSDVMMGGGGVGRGKGRGQEPEGCLVGCWQGELYEGFL